METTNLNSMENVFGSSLVNIYGESWNVVMDRKFNNAEVNAIRSASIVDSKYGKSVCFLMKAGGSAFIPVGRDSVDSVNVGASVNPEKCRLLKLTRQGDNPILRVEIEA